MKIMKGILKFIWTLPILIGCVLYQIILWIIGIISLPIDFLIVTPCQIFILDIFNIDEHLDFYKTALLLGIYTYLKIWGINLIE